jgi:hypothetical protein
MAERLLLALLLLAALALLTACSHLTTRVGTPITSEPEGLEGATLDRVLGELGAPSRLSAAPRGGFFLLYESIVAEERQIGFSIPVRWLNYFKIAFGRGRAERRQLVVRVSESGVVESLGGEASDEDLGGGTGVQLIVSVVPTVDIRDLREPPFQHAWGRGLLARVPEGLNRGSSLETGASGLELRGTPTRAGQHTLEQRSSRSIWRRKR